MGWKERKEEALQKSHLSMIKSLKEGTHGLTQDEGAEKWVRDRQLSLFHWKRP